MAVILVIDDDPAMRRLMVRTLSAQQHRVIEAENGEDGLKLLNSEKPDLVITDILMPQKEGIETIREIQERTPGTKIIAVSGGGSSQKLMFLDIARAFGAEAVLAKPFRPNQLIEAVESALNSSASRA